MAGVKPIPDDMSTIVPYLTVNDSAAAIDFYKRAFGAVEVMRMAGPGGKIGHAQIKIRNFTIMMADAYPNMGCKEPLTLGGTPVALMLYVTDVDAIFRQAKAAGAKVTQEPKDQFYGDRVASVTDPFGHVWHLATHKEDIADDEMQRRGKAAIAEWEKTQQPKTAA